MKRGAVVITGASGGIGRALVRAFAKAGYRVVASDVEHTVRFDRDVVFVKADLERTVRDRQYAQSVFAEITDALKGQPLKALINNAAVQILGAAKKLSRSDWQRTLDVNLLAPFFWTQGLLTTLERGHGCVINVSSIHARLTKSGFAAYATSKAALSGMTRALAVELGSKVRVNAIEPAAIDTPMLRAGFAGDNAGYRRLQRFHPTGAIGTPEQVAMVAIALAEQPLAFLNGSIVALDGGIGAALHDPASA